MSDDVRESRAGALPGTTWRILARAETREVTLENEGSSMSDPVQGPPHAIGRRHHPDAVVSPPLHSAQCAPSVVTRYWVFGSFGIQLRRAQG